MTAVPGCIGSGASGCPSRWAGEGAGAPRGVLPPRVCEFPCHIVEVAYPQRVASVVTGQVSVSPTWERRRPRRHGRPFMRGLGDQSMALIPRFHFNGARGCPTWAGEGAGAPRGRAFRRECGSSRVLGYCCPTPQPLCIPRCGVGLIQSLTNLGDDVSGAGAGRLT